jgi:hypothetical protein
MIIGFFLLLPTQLLADVLTQEQLREFKARQGVIVFAPVTLDIKNPRYRLLKGERTPEGICKFKYTYKGKLADLSKETAETTVDIAIDWNRCEKTVLTGELPMEEIMRERLRNAPGTSFIPAS